MRRAVSMLMVLLLIALPALAEEAQFSPFDYRKGSAGGGRYVYYGFPDIQLLLPGDWDGRFTLVQSDDGTTFYQTASYERCRAEGIAGDGLLFELRASADESFRELPAYEYLGYSENAGLHFYLLMPSDYPPYPDDAVMAEYDEMAAQIDVVVAEARISPNMSFYTKGVESTDVGMS